MAEGPPIKQSNILEVWTETYFLYTIFANVGFIAQKKLFLYANIVNYVLLLTTSIGKTK